MSEKNYCVYIHTNLINDKKYVGVTCQKPEYRWNHGEGYKHSSHFYSAIKKYGWENFSHEIVADGLSENEAKEMEIELIAELDTMNRLYGYNSTIGGDGLHGYKASEETKRKISEFHTGRKRNEETKRKLSEAAKRNYPKQAEQLLEGRYKPVAMYDINDVFIKAFKSIVEAAAYIGATNAQRIHITLCCRGKRKTSAGYKWKYIT